MYASKFLSFIADVIDTADKHSLANISVNFRQKIRNNPNVILRGPGETPDLWKKPEVV
jgi:hypothetical protein